MGGIARAVNNISGLSVTDVEDAEYIEFDADQRDYVFETVIESNDLPEDVEILRRIDVLDLLVVYEAAKALVEANVIIDLQEGDQPNGVRYGDAFSNAFTSLEHAVVVAGR